MAEEYAIGTKVQAVDELGRWAEAKIVRKEDEEWMVSFPGYPDCDRFATADEVRCRIPPLAEQERRYGCSISDRRQSRKAKTGNHKFFNECQRGDQVETALGIGIVQTVDPFNKTIELTDGSTVSFSEVVLPVQETPVDVQPCKRRKRNSCHSLPKTSADSHQSDVVDRAVDPMAPESSIRDTQEAPNWGAFRIGRFQCGKLYEVKRLAITVMVFSLDLKKKTAACWPCMDQTIDKDTTVTVKLDRLVDTKVMAKGEVKKTGASLACNAFKFAVQNHGHPGYREEFRKAQVAGAIRQELEAAFRSRTRRKLFDLGLYSLETDNNIFGIDAPNTTTAEFNHRKDNIGDLDGLLGVGWDVSAKDGVTRFVTAIRFRLTSQFTLTGSIKVADYDAELNTSQNHRAILRSHVMSEVENLELPEV